VQEDIGSDESTANPHLEADCPIKSGRGFHAAVYTAALLRRQPTRLALLPTTHQSGNENVHGSLISEMIAIGDGLGSL
jgi:hypothetical protein